MKAEVRDDARGFLFEMLEMTSGPLIWFAHLVVVYGISSLACARHGPRPVDSGDVVAATFVSSAVALAAVGLMLVRTLRDLRGEPASEGRRFVDRVTLALCGFALVAIVWTALPAVLGPECVRGSPAEPTAPLRTP